MELKNYPYWRYAKLDLTTDQTIFRKPLEFGFNYFLHGIIISYPATKGQLQGTSGVTLDLIQPARKRPLFENMPADLISTPCGLNTGEQVQELWIFHPIQYLYDSGDVVIIRINRTATGPESARILLVGQNMEYLTEYNNR